VRAVALLWVVTIHVAAVPVVQLFSTARPWWWWANLYNSASRAAVPLFIMVSGALLLNGPWRGLKCFASRRIAKVVVPLIAWTFLYMANSFAATSSRDWSIRSIRISGFCT
jgi:surface polysaccharide O-acyltransferase-like enzyme